MSTASCVKRLIIVCVVMLCAGSASAAMLTVDQYILYDNVDFSYNNTAISIDGINLAGGGLSAKIRHSLQKHETSSFGIASFGKKFVILDGSFMHPIGPATISIRGGVQSMLGRDNENGTAFSLGGEFSTAAALGKSGAWLTPVLSVDYGPASDNPVSRAVGIKKLSAAADLGFSFNRLEWHLFYKQKWYGGAGPDMYSPYLDDPAFFHAAKQFALKEDTSAGIASNTIMHTGFYTFGVPISSAPWLYAGASVNYEHALHDMYTPLTTEVSGGAIPLVHDSSTEYAHFPYRTPKKEFSTHLIIAAAFALNRRWAPVSEGKVKFSLPIVSFSDGYYYYQETYGQLQSFRKDSYKTHGLGPITMELSLIKQLPNGLSLKGEATYFARPYMSYRFFGKNSYNYVDGRIGVTKKFGTSQ